jgi:hypothetical protein
MICSGSAECDLAKGWELPPSFIAGEVIELRANLPVIPASSLPFHRQLTLFKPIALGEGLSRIYRYVQYRY